MSSEPPREPFDLDEVIRRVRKAVRPYPKPALFALADQGYRTPFEQLVACIISIRTRDEVTEPVARELFRHARTPAEIEPASAGGDRPVDPAVDLPSGQGAADFGDRAPRPRRTRWRAALR